jgi:hypothetical protein
MNAVDKVHYVHHSPLPPQLTHTLHDSWTALSKGRQDGSPFPASTYASQSKPFQADQAGDGRGLAPSYTWSLAKPYKGIYYPASGYSVFWYTCWVHRIYMSMACRNFNSSRFLLSRPLLSQTEKLFPDIPLVSMIVIGSRFQ